MREAQIRNCLAQGEGSVAAIVARLYPDLAPALHKAAGLMVRAHLEKLRAESRAEERDGIWKLSG